jgi:hypothetical protein
VSDFQGTVLVLKGLVLKGPELVVKGTALVVIHEMRMD